MRVWGGKSNGFTFKKNKLSGELLFFKKQLGQGWYSLIKIFLAKDAKTIQTGTLVYQSKDNITPIIYDVQTTKRRIRVL